MLDQILALKDILTLCQLTGQHSNLPLFLRNLHVWVLVRDQDLVDRVQNVDGEFFYCEESLCQVLQLAFLLCQLKFQRGIILQLHVIRVTLALILTDPVLELVELQLVCLLDLEEMLPLFLQLDLVMSQYLWDHLLWVR